MELDRVESLLVLCQCDRNSSEILRQSDGLVEMRRLTTSGFKLNISQAARTVVAIPVFVSEFDITNTSFLI